MKNEPKLKVFDFGAFQNKMHMASREKYIFHILFGAFHGTPRIYKVCSIAGFTIYFIRLVKSNNTNKINQIILKSLLHVSDSFDPFEFELLVFPCVFRFTINEYENSNAV